MSESKPTRTVKQFTVARTARHDDWDVHDGSFVFTRYEIAEFSAAAFGGLSAGDEECWRRSPTFAFSAGAFSKTKTANRKNAAIVIKCRQSRTRPEIGKSSVDNVHERNVQVVHPTSPLHPNPTNAQPDP